MSEPQEILTVEEFNRKYKRGPGKRAVTVEEVDARPKGKQLRPFPPNKKLSPSLFVNGLNDYCCPVCSSPLYGRYGWHPDSGASGIVKCIGCDWQRIL